MASTGNDSDEYLPDSDDSNYYEDSRPNQWKGHPSTWQQLNSAEIDTYTALNEIRNQDLSVHLYNAFALKNRHENPEGKGRLQPVINKDIDVATGQPIQGSKWVPPKSWTAWPLPVNTVPKPGFMKRVDDDDDRFTFRKAGQDTPKAELEEVISATVLRLAKERFRARQSKLRDASTTAVSSGPESNGEGYETEASGATLGPGGRSRTRLKSQSRSIKHESASEAEMMDIDGPDSDTRGRSERSKAKILLKPVVGTDDELSYTLTRPSAQQMLEKLDATLVVLHNAQELRMQCSSDSDTSDASSRSSSRSRSRSLSRSRFGDAMSRGNSPQPPMTPGKKRVGRPRKEYPRLEGETEREYLIRVARIQKKPLPVFLDDDADAEPMTDATPIPRDKDGKAKRKTKTKSKGKGKEKATPRSDKPKARTQSRKRRDSTEPLSDATVPGEPRGRFYPRKDKLRPRDWKEIIGAAALAGFPAPVLDRAARRCADLFGQSFELHTLPEGPSADPVQTKRYVPGMMAATGGIPPPFLDDDENDWEEDSADGDIDYHLRQRLRSHTPGTSSALLSEGDRDRGRQTQGRGLSAAPSLPPPRSKSRSRSRSRSASAGGAIYFCIVGNCPRAVDAFTRRANLMRHLKLVHNFDGEGQLPVEVDSEDEMHGAVHVDGFLKPIKMRGAWRKNNEGATRERGRRRL